MTYLVSAVQHPCIGHDVEAGPCVVLLVLAIASGTLAVALVRRN